LSIFRREHFLAAIKRAAREQRRWRESNLWRPWWIDEAGIGGVGGGAQGITSIGHGGCQADSGSEQAQRGISGGGESATCGDRRSA